MKMTRNSHGFTLIELLSVVAILAVLAAILLPLISKARASAYTAKAVANMRVIGQATALYSSENREAIFGSGEYYNPIMGKRKEGAEFRITRYLNELAYFKGWDSVMPILYTLHDPAVPAEVTWGPTTYRYALCFNSEFREANSNKDNPQLNSKFYHEYFRPESTLYITTGIWEFKESMCEDIAMSVMPTTAARSGFYFPHDGRTVGLFLDKHVELLGFPIQPYYVNPRLETR